MLNIIHYLKDRFSRQESRDVALVLGGGGARGYAHIGAIEALLANGYRITSIAGTSMGALVGGLYAAGEFDELKHIVSTVTRRQILSLIDVSIGLDHIATADRLSKLLDQMTGGVRIEQLPIPFCCPASDLASGREFLFTSGPLSEAIRASISIPGIFSPVRSDGRILVDGSLHNTLPLNRVARHKGDLLVAVNASAPDVKPYGSMAAGHGKLQKVTWNWLKTHLQLLDARLSDNYLRMSLRVAQISVQNNTQMAMALNKPDLCVDIPMDAFGLLDFERGAEIIAFGRKAMETCLQKMTR